LIMGFDPVKLQLAMAQAVRPLAGRRVVVTRAREQAGELVRALADLGADVLTVPSIRIEPLADLQPLRAALDDPARYRWIVFTSQNTVQIVCDALAAWGEAPSRLAAARVAAIGPATGAALAGRGVRVDVLPTGYVAEALVEAIAAEGDLEGAQVLIPRAETARDALPEGLRARGAQVAVVPVYRTVPALDDGAALARRILAGEIDAITFTSSSTVHHFARAVGPAAARSARYAAAVIGPVTAATAREYGLPVTVEAAEYTTHGVVEALVRYFTGSGPRAGP
jgi:uroporphyrinogen III methyltransferase / synthase